MMGERLRNIRKEYGMTQEKLAKMLNVSVHTISSYERSKSEPDDEAKKKIGELFNVSLDYLLGLTDDKCSYVRSGKILSSPEFTENDLDKIRDYAELLLIKRKSEIKVGHRKVMFSDSKTHTKNDKARK